MNRLPSGGVTSFGVIMFADELVGASPAALVEAAAAAEARW